MSDLITKLETENFASKITKGASVASFYTIDATVSGKTVTISLLVDFGTVPATGATVATIPAGYRAKRVQRVPAITYDGSANNYIGAIVVMGTDGLVLIQGNPLRRYLAVTLTYQI